MKALTATHIEMEAWATPRVGMSLDELVEELLSTGNSVLEIDKEKNRIKVSYAKEEI